MPYLPEGKDICYVQPTNRFIRKAGKILKNSGCVKQATAAVLVKDGKIIGRGANAGKKVKICPRVVQNYPTGQGYHLCKETCRQEGHAEVMAIKNALFQGYDTDGATLYLEGHWWVCKECWNFIILHGIKRVCLREDSMQIYKK